MTDYYSPEQKRLPRSGLLALAMSLMAYVVCMSGLFESSATLIGIVLLVTGAIQILIGMRSQQQGHPYAAATLLPFGMFWLSIIGYEIFPRIGIGLPPNAVAMFSYLSIWSLFVAILFLRSFRQRLAMQYLYGTMMVCLMALSLDQLREDSVFLAIGCVFGLFSALVAAYVALLALPE
ncbi:Succinate-acetate transporter protein [Desulfuromusa kysingii]|uniref:Succinate-acetate transporter protein n=1 Tax=Desulfuromusa kysingii TaxID=37625 RepID=A0A1H3XF69_9BACT|nr:acetate uptake transporter [Desulfuromusa kysingii]SDZ97314.1 Succinate-acetate transporter protein [Desulfuromusa kysingii]